MHLVSRSDQVVRVGGMPFVFAAGETIHTENSYKYSLPALADLARASGFAPERVWTDEHQYFGVADFALRGGEGMVRFLGGSAVVRCRKLTKPFL